MADLFDVSVGGVGWHFTSHLIALAALFIACFAIAGYITFRDDSIPAKAVKDGEGFEDEDITAKSLTLSGKLTTSKIDAGLLQDLDTYTAGFAPANAIGGTTSTITRTSIAGLPALIDSTLKLTQSYVVNGDLTTGINLCNDLFGTSRTAFVAELDLSANSDAADFGTLVDGINFVKATGDPQANNCAHTLPTPVAGRTIVVVFSTSAALDNGQTMEFDCTNALDNNSGLIDTATGNVVVKGAAGHSIVRLTSGGANAGMNGFIMFKPAGTSYQVISMLSQASQTLSTQA